jgi:hypothetical protein
MKGRQVLETTVVDGRTLTEGMRVRSRTGTALYSRPNWLSVGMTGQIVSITRNLPRRTRLHWHREVLVEVQFDTYDQEWLYLFCPEELEAEVEA